MLVTNPAAETSWLPSTFAIISHSVTLTPTYVLSLILLVIPAPPTLNATLDTICWSLLFVRRMELVCLYLGHYRRDDRNQPELTFSTDLVIHAHMTTNVRLTHVLEDIVKEGTKMSLVVMMLIANLVYTAKINNFARRELDW